MDCFKRHNLLMVEGLVTRLVIAVAKDNRALLLRTTEHVPSCA